MECRRYLKVLFEQMIVNSHNLISSGIGMIVRKVPFLRDRIDEHMLELLNGTAIALLMKVMGAGLAFAFNVVIARKIGAEGSGIFYLALTVATVATIFGRMGLDNAVLRFTAANASVSDWAAVKGVYRKGMSISLAASAVTTAVVFVLSSWIAGTIFSKPEIASPLRWMSLSILPISLAFLHSEALKGLKKIFGYAFIQGQNGVSLSLFSLAGLYLLGALGVQGAVLSYVLSAAVTATIGYFLWRHATPQLKGIAGNFRASMLLKTSMPLFWVSSMNVILTWTSTFFLGIWGSSREVGIFSMASRTALLISLVLMAVNSIAAPKFAALYAKGDKKTLGRITVNSSGLMAVLASPVFLTFVFAPHWVMGFFGPKFADGSTALIILSVGQFVSVCSGSVQYLLMMSGNEKDVRNDVFLTVAVNVGLNCLLTPKFGITGAAIAASTGLAVRNIAAVWIVKHRLGIQSMPFFR
jgi:O-antigen/teichoic acid export membrane protein